MKYIILPYNKALEAGIITKDTTRRTNQDKTKIILYEDDLNDYNPIVDYSNDNIKVLLDNLSDKVSYLDGVIVDKDEIVKQINQGDWN